MLRPINPPSLFPDRQKGLLANVLFFSMPFCTDNTNYCMTALSYLSFYSPSACADTLTRCISPQNGHREIELSLPVKYYHWGAFKCRGVSSLLFISFTMPPFRHNGNVQPSLSDPLSSSCFCGANHFFAYAINKMVLMEH